MIKAVESYGYSASGVSVQNAVAPLSITINPTPNCEAIGNGVVEGTAVTKKCAVAPVVCSIGTRAVRMISLFPMFSRYFEWCKSTEKDSSSR